MDLHQEISTGLNWIEKRAKSIGGVSLVISVLCLFHYITYWNVSVSITNPALLPALGVMLVIVIYAELVLGFTVMLPVGVLFTSLWKKRKDQKKPEGEQQGPVLYELLMKDKTHVNSRLAGWPVFLWIGQLVLATLLLLGVPSVLSEAGKSDSILIPFGLFLGFMALDMGVPLVLIRIRGGLRWADLSWDFRMSLAFASLMQLLCVAGVVQVVTHWVGSMDETSTNEALWRALVVCAIAVAVIRLGQLCAAKFYVHVISQKDEQRKPLYTILHTVVMALMLLTLFPPIGASMAAIAFQMPASGARGCAVLRWSADAGSNVDTLRDPANPSLSQALRIPFDIDDVYQVRLRNESKAIWFVPHNKVIGIDDCSLSTSASKEAAAKTGDQ